MKNCHRALPENGKLILIEAIVPGTSAAWQIHGSEHAVMTGGRERTEKNFELCKQQVPADAHRSQRITVQRD